MALNMQYTKSRQSQTVKLQKLNPKNTKPPLESSESHHQGRIRRRLRGLSLFTYIFSISFNGRLDPSGWLTNFQPPPFPRFPRGPSFSITIFHPSEDRLRLYLWHFTSPAICIAQPRQYHPSVLCKDYREELQKLKSKGMFGSCF